MKYILIILVLGAAGYFGWQALQTKPDPSTPQATVTDPATTDTSSTPTTPQESQGESRGRVRPVDNENVVVSFRGFGPGKEHIGSFSNITSDLALDETGSMSGTITVGMDSMSTDTERLTSHLKSKDFFEVAKYPTATFTLTSISNGRATGSMTIRGIKKDVSFPITILESNPEQYAAKFTLNMKDFGINQTFANETIELSVVVPLK